MTPFTETPQVLTSAGDTSHESRRRYRRIFAAALSSLFGKGTNFLVSAVTVPLTVRYLGGEGYGLWITISSAVMMFFVLDIGIANTLTNFISRAYAAGDRELAASYFATALWLVIGVVTLLGIVGWMAWPFIHWPLLFDVQNPLLVRQCSHAVAAAFLVFLFALPSGLAARALAGYQELHLANYFAAGGSIAGLIGVIVVIHMHGSLTPLVAVYAGAPAVANAVCLAWISFVHKPWLKPWLSRIRRPMIGDIFRSGGQFFLIQIAGLAVFNSDNLVISHYLSPAQVTPYNITWKIASYITAVPVLVVPALWPAFSEAHARGDIAWIRKAYARNRWITVAVLAVGCLILLTAGMDIIRLWAGRAAVPSSLLLRLMCVWMFIFAITLNQSCLMGATNRVGKQAVYGPLAALVNLLLSIIWVRTHGPEGVLLATIVTYLLFVLAAQTYEVRRILRGDFIHSKNTISCAISDGARAE